VSIGDLPAARLLLLRIAETHNARAAFELGATYDPNVIKKLEGVSAASDLALARAWYQRAQDWGLSDASKQLEALANADR
jgi:TPR repeat protein